MIFHLRSAISVLLLAGNTIISTLLLFPLVLLKILIPHKKFRIKISYLLASIGEWWISNNNFLFDLTQNTTWDISGSAHLAKDRSYLISCNHQSWFDIVILQRVFNRRIPFLRFFLKRELIFAPLLGAAWWALDFPFMRRYSSEYLQKHPEKKGADLLTTKKACEKFREFPVTLVNFLEGTRFTSKKHKLQRSPFKNLLTPRAGGLAFTLQSMNGQIKELIDVTIIYPQGPKNLWRSISGQKNHIIVKYRTLKIPDWISKAGSTFNYLENPEDREKFQAWVNELWQMKDQEISLSLT